jgi:hypothetical protein
LAIPIKVLFAASVASMFGCIPLAQAQQAGTACQAIQSISGTASGTGATNGIPGIFLPGDTITISAALGTATAGVFRITGNFTGVPTLAGPANAPATLTYSVVGPLPPGSIGVGYFVDSANGTLIITASCTNVPFQIPATSTWGLAALALLIGGSTLLYLRRRNG